MKISRRNVVAHARRGWQTLKNCNSKKWKLISRAEYHFPEERVYLIISLGTFQVSSYKVGKVRRFSTSHNFWHDSISGAAVPDKQEDSFLLKETDWRRRKSGIGNSPREVFTQFYDGNIINYCEWTINYSSFTGE